jgi:hypothetical protein
MAKFLVRVELKGETNKNSRVYTELHDRLEVEGFVRYVTINEKKVALPHATYKLSGNYTPATVKAKVLTVVKKLWNTPLVVVVEYTTLACNLAP